MLKAIVLYLKWSENRNINSTQFSLTLHTKTKRHDQQDLENEYVKIS